MLIRYRRHTLWIFTPQQLSKLCLVRFKPTPIKVLTVDGVLSNICILSETQSSSKFTQTEYTASISRTQA